MFVLFFALQLLTVLLPFQPLDPAWQWRLSTVLINGAPLPLLALALLLIAGQLDPVLKQRRRLFGQLAVAAAIGFLVLLPLQFSAGLPQQDSLSSAQLSRIAGAEQRLATLRQATASATSNAQLNAILQKLGAAVLSPADLGQPLLLVKMQLNAALDQAQIQINRDRAAMPPAPAIAALPEVLRNSLACLFFA